MDLCENVPGICSYMAERERRLCELYRFMALSVPQGEAKTLLERLAARGQEFLQKLEESKQTGVFQNRPCELPDTGFFDTLEPPDAPGQSIPEILIFAIWSKHDSYLLCEEAARSCAVAEVKQFWLVLAEEERRHRLELESCYQDETIA